MSTDNTVGLIGYLGVIALVLLGLFIIVRGLFTGLTGSQVPLTSPVGFGRGVVGRTITSLLSFAVAYKFFSEGYADRLYGYETMLGMAIFALLAMVLIPPVETLVAVAALTVFLMQNTAVFGQAALGTFLMLLLTFGFLRWILGR